MNNHLRMKTTAVVLAALWSGFAMADTLTPTVTPPGTALAVDIPQDMITYEVLDGAAGVVGTFFYDNTDGLWKGPAGWANALDPMTGEPLPGTLVINAGTPNQQTVTFPTPPVTPSLDPDGPATTTAVGADFDGTETTTSSALGMGATISDSTVVVTAPGTQPVVANPDPINYTYLSAANPALDVAGDANYNGDTSVDGTGSPTASGDVTVTSATPAYQTGTYTVDFDDDLAGEEDTTGTLTGGSVELSGDGLFFNALTGTGMIDTDTGVITTAIIETPTTSITAAGIQTNSLTVGSLTDDGPVGDLTVFGMTNTNGIDNGSQRITNVAPGILANDAATVGQLNDGLTAVNRNIREVRQDLSKGIAAVTAIANIPQVDTGKTFSVGVGVGSYDSETAFAIGGSVRVMPNAVLKASVGTGSSSGDTAFGLGVAASW